jgi:short-subunit dehydrogenase
MYYRFRRKKMKALVTGASSGIGEEIAKELGKRGYDIILVARNEEKLKDVASKIKTKTRIITMDLSNKENCKKLYEETKNEDIDILINNAGFGVHGKFCDTDLNKEVQMIETNITAVHILMKLYLKDMIKKDRGHILNVASMAAFGPGPLMISYYASKAYVYRLSQGVKTELRKNNSKVKISVLCPGPVRTNFNKVAGVDFAAPSLSSEYVAKYAVKKMLKNKFTIVPGTFMKITRFFEKIMPHNLVSNVSYFVNYRKDK